MNKNVWILLDQNISIIVFFPKCSIHQKELEHF